MAQKRRKAIPDPVTNRLYALSGNQCYYPGCTNPVTDQLATGQQPVTLAQRAHIVGIGRQGPRSHAARLSDDPDAVENLLLLCGVHHPMVDKNPRIFSVEVLAKFKADHEERMAPPSLLSPTRETGTEVIDLSLLPIAGLPATIWKAPPKFRTTEEVASHLPRPKGQQVLPFVLLGGMIWAFHDLSESRGPFRDAVDRSSSTRIAADKLLRSSDCNVYVWLLNAALRQALLRRGVRHDRAHNRYYFLADHETVTRRVEARTKTGRAQSAKKVVRQEGERTGNPRDVWWHLAAQLRFEEFATGAWGLTIRPEFHLTKDGREPLDPRRVGQKVTRRKSRMYNESYFDAVHFFRYFLLQGGQRLVLRTGQQMIVVEGNFASCSATWAAIDDKRFDPLSVLDTGDEDDVLDAVVGSLDLDDDDWDWGAEHEEDR